MPKPMTDQRLAELKRDACLFSVDPVMADEMFAEIDRLRALPRPLTLLASFFARRTNPRRPPRVAVVRRGAGVHGDVCAMWFLSGRTSQ